MALKFVPGVGYITVPDAAPATSKPQNTTGAVKADGPSTVVTGGNSTPKPSTPAPSSSGQKANYYETIEGGDISLQTLMDKGWVRMGVNGPEWTGNEPSLFRIPTKSGGLATTGKSTILQNAKRQALFPTYFDDKGKPIGSLTKVMTNEQGRTLTGGRSSPETAPWAHGSGSVDLVTGKDYGNATFPGGRPGYPEIPQIPWEQRVALAQQRVEGLPDPNLFAGMTRYGRSTPNSPNPYSNQFGTYTPSYTGYSNNGWTGFGPTFRGVDQQGNYVNYQGQSPYGSAHMAALQNMAAPGTGFSRGGSSGGFQGSGGPTQPGGSPSMGGGGGLPGNGTLPGGPPSAGNGPFIGTPGSISVGGAAQGAPQWWQQMMQQEAGRARGAQAQANPLLAMQYSIPAMQAAALRGQNMNVSTSLAGA